MLLSLKKLILLTGFLYLASQTSYAQPGQPDLSFDLGGNLEASKIAQHL